MLGYTMDDVRQGRVNWKEMTVPEHRHLDERAIELVRTQGSHPPFEKTLVRKDGSRIPVLAATAYLGGPGETGVGFLVDLTDVKLAQQQVQDSEQRLQAIIDNVAAIVYVKDVEGRYLLINRHYQQVLSIDAQRMIGRTDYDFFDREVADKFVDNDRRVLETGEATQFEEVAVHPDGPHTYVSVKFPLRDARGAIYAICGVSTDINERKKAEEALRHSEGKYRSLTDAVGSLMWMSDAKGQLCFFNRRWDEFLAGNTQQILGLGWKQLVHPDDLDAVVRERTAALAEGREYTVEYRLRRHDGQYRWHLTRILPHKDADGRILNWFGMATDIHDLKLAEDAVLQAKAEAEHANKAKDQFLAVLSHELRTPLTPVVMTVAAMEMDRTISPQLREDLAMIRRNIELETKLIDDLLDVTRIANGKLRLQPRAADVHALLKNVLEILKSDVSEKRLNVAVDLAAPDPSVFADPARLQQVFWNLIKNAIKFAAPGGNVTVKTWNASESVVCVEVTDDGAGIELSVLPRIFNAFDQGEQTITRQFGGLGLGLAISKALTELHGGQIHAESDGKGKGARFTVELPTRTPVERMVDQIQPIGPGADGRPKPRVLLVEDHLDTQRTLRRLLEERGYEVLTAGSVAAALAALAATPVEVLVSDIGLPDSTGYELMRQVRERYKIPGVAVSGFGMDGDLKASHDAGFAIHMTKPVDIQQLDGMIRSLLPRSAAAAAATAAAAAATGAQRMPIA
jgi:PAS domain S-box-containing protein